MHWTNPLLGFAVGLLVGLTGIGGAALMTPLLILVGGVRPVIAVGTDLAYGAITKAVGAFLHCRQQTVDFPIAKHLAMGSIPAALLGVALIRWMRGGIWNEGVAGPFWPGERKCPAPGTAPAGIPPWGMSRDSFGHPGSGQGLEPDPGDRLEIYWW